MSENSILDRAFDLHDEGKYKEAMEAYIRGLEISPGVIEAHNNLGVVFDELGQYEDAAEAYKKALEINPEYPLSLRNLGRAYAHLDRHEEAYEAYSRALALNGKDELAHKGVGEALVAMKEAGHARRAAELAQVWGDQFPGNAFARHLVPIILETGVPERANDTYVRAIFDEFADSFDRILSDLDYKAPELIRDALKKKIGRTKKNLSVLDAGCGTGRCAPYLRPMSKWLEGVDLSAEMLEKAKARNLYDEIHQKEITAFLKAHRKTYDIIVAADVFCYFGRLDEVLSAMFSALKPDGLALFTLERAKREEAEPYLLDPTGRYEHTRAYVQETLAEAGFGLLELQDVPELRKEGGQPVPGILTVGRHP